MWKTFLLIFGIITIASSSKSPRIVGGKDAVAGQFPWQVAITNTRTNSETVFCTGALFSDEWIITSAHCVDGAERLEIWSGVVDFTDSDRTESVTSNYIIHEEYDSSTLKNDIALVQLESSLSFDDNTKAIRLADSSYTLSPGITVTISGWGHSSTDDDANATYTLQCANVTTITLESCQSYYGANVISDNHICAFGYGNDGQTPCFGDGGAPLVVNAETWPSHVGIFSFVSTYGCVEDYPAGFTRTMNYRDWITNKTGI